MTEIVESVITALQDELQVHQELSRVLDNKLDAMRHYDLSRLEALSVKEKRLVETIRQRGLQREGAVRQAAGAYYPDRPGAQVTAGQLAEAVREPARSRLLTLASLLKDVAQNIQRLNGVITNSTRRLLDHFDSVFKMIAECGSDIGLYGRGGKKAVLEQRRIVDALA